MVYLIFNVELKVSTTIACPIFPSFSASISKINEFMVGSYKIEIILP